jgi:hypothetical protein
VKCGTKQGSLQCEHEHGHTGPCEMRAPEYATGKDAIRRIAALERRISELNAALDARLIGPTGPTGPVGPTGATGATGPSAAKKK